MSVVNRITTHLLISLNDPFLILKQANQNGKHSNSDLTREPMLWLLSPTLFHNNSLNLKILFQGRHPWLLSQRSPLLHGQIQTLTRTFSPLMMKSIRKLIPRPSPKLTIRKVIPRPSPELTIRSRLLCLQTRTLTKIPLPITTPLYLLHLNQPHSRLRSLSCTSPSTRILGVSLQELTTGFVSTTATPSARSSVAISMALEIAAAGLEWLRCFLDAIF